MFEPIASALARFTTRRPWLAIVAVVALVAVLGSQGMPSMSNDSSEFAPDAPAIAAAERIDELFGADASVTPLQVVFTSASGDVVTTAGLAAVARVTEAIRATEADGARLADFLVAQAGTGDVVSFLAPVAMAVANGAPSPASDAEVKAALLAGLERVPSEQVALLAGLFDDPAALEAGSAGAGLLVAFLRTPTSAAEEATLIDLQGQLASSLQALDLGDITALPFSTELIAWAGDGAGIQIPLLLFAAIGIIGLALLVLYLPRRVMPVGQRLRRTFADTLLSLLVVIFAIVTVNGAGVLLGPGGLGLIGQVSGPSSIVPILLVGLGVDYAIHLNAAYRNGLGAGDAVDAAMSRSLRVVGGALVLSSITTAFGFLTNLFSGTSALATFGVLATIGIAAAFFYSTLLFPAARVLLDRRAARKDRLPAAAFEAAETGWIDRAVEATAVIPRRAPWLAVGAAGLVLVGAALISTNLRSGFSFLDFVPVGSPVREAATVLTDRFSGGLGESTQVLVEGDITQPALWNETLDATAAAASFANVVVLDGSPRVRSPQQVVASLVDPDSPQFVPAVADAAAAAGLDATLRAGDGADLAAVLTAARAAAPEAVAGVVADEAALFIFTTQAGVDGALELARELEGAFPAGSVATSRGIIDATVVEAISSTQTQSLILALVAAALLLMLNFRISDRRPLLGLLTIAPVGGVVVLLYAFMVLAGIEFGPVTATLAAVVIGVGIDYTIHVTHRFQEFRREGMSVDDATRHTLGTTGSALAASAVTTALGFAVLTQSTLIPFQQFGILILVAVAASAAASILVLPSMLTIWARWSERRSGAAGAVGTASELRVDAEPPVA